MNKLLKMLRKNWIRVWLVCILAALSMFTVVAAYTEVSSVKRVVSTTGTSVIPFSSNYLKSSVQNRRLTTVNNIELTICNYDQDHTRDYSSSVINYTLEAELYINTSEGLKPMSYIYNNDSEKYAEYVTRAAKYKIKKSSDDSQGSSFNADDPNNEKTFTADANHNYKLSFPQDSLRAGRAAVDTYTITLDPDDISRSEPEFFVWIKAVPTNKSLSTLEARLYCAKPTVSNQAKWNGRFVEKDFTTEDHDFYNYLITGSGAGRLDILWDPTKIEINKFFLENILAVDYRTVYTIGDGNCPYNTTVVPGTSTSYSPLYNGWKMISITMSGTTADKNRYEFQVYKTSEIDNPTNYINTYFQESTPEESTP